MVEAAPPAPFIITEAEFLFELLIIALDPPPQFRRGDQTIESDILGQGGKPIFGRLGFVLRALDQKPLFSAQLAQHVIAMRGRTRRRAKHDASETEVPTRQGLLSR